VYRLGLAHSFHVCFYFSFFLCTLYDIHFHNNNNNVITKMAFRPGQYFEGQIS